MSERDQNNVNEASFVHLHTHTEHSLLDGLGRLDDVCAAAKADGQPAIAQTDHGNLDGSWRFVKAAKKAGIKPILGIEAYLAIEDLTDAEKAEQSRIEGHDADAVAFTRTDDDPSPRHRRNYLLVPRDEGDYGDGDDEKIASTKKSNYKVKRYEHLTILARNTTGWKNLVAMQNKAQRTYWYHPRIDMELLAEHGEGLIVLTGCLAGPIAGSLLRGDRDAAVLKMRRLIRAVGRENVYVEIMEHGIGVEAKVLRGLIDLAQNWTDADGNPDPLPLVVTNDSHYVHGPDEHGHGGDCDAHDAWLAVGTRALLSDRSRFRFNGTGYHLRSSAEMRSLVSDSNAELERDAVRRHLLGRLAVRTNESVATYSAPDQKQTLIDSLRAMPERAVTKLRNEATHSDEFINQLVREFTGLMDLIVAIIEKDGTIPPAAVDARIGAHLDNITTLEPVDPAVWAAACDETLRIAERCEDDVLVSPGLQLPKFPIPDEYKDAPAFLKHLVAEGATRNYGRDDNGRLRDDVNERLKMEFPTITDMGFADYFLIVWDLVNWARSDRGLPTAETPEGESGQKKPIIVGPGRGSAAGSLVSYCLGIVDLCPLENDLLFERFLEPGRLEMPDIDLDFESGRRDEVLAYLAARWGAGRVSRIGSFGQSLSRRAIKDAARVHERTDLANALTKHIEIKGGKPAPFSILDDTENKSSQDFREVANEGGPDMQAVLDHARAFEGVVNGVGQHACGVLIAPTDLADLIPIRYDRRASAPYDEDGNPTVMITCWDSKDIEAFGLLKLDVLGLENLDIIAATLDGIERSTGQSVSLADIPAHDTKNDVRLDKTWDLLCAESTAGIFQLESSGMTELIGNIAPRSFEDLSAAIALYRPGPLSANMHTRYVERKHGREDIDYSIYTPVKDEQDLIATVLGETYGVYVYQEQVMRLGTVMAGFDVSMRSKLRKAVGKKDPVLMAEVGEKFRVGCVEEQYDESGNLISPRFLESTANTMWEAFKGAADYLFNKSHTAAYGKLSYYTAYLKANYPVEYGAAILAVTDKEERRFATLQSLDRDGIEVLQPDVNLSFPWTAAELDEEGTPTGRIRLGLEEIKGVGKAGSAVYAERERGGSYDNLHALVSRLKESNSDVNIGAIEGLIEAGAMDSFGSRRGLMQIARASGSGVLDVPEGDWSSVERSMMQRERLGVSLGVHPMEVEKEHVDSIQTNTVEMDRYDNPIGQQVVTEDGRAGSKPDPMSVLRRGSVLTVGIIAHWAEFSGARGRFARMTLEDPTTRMDGMVWSEALGRLSNQRIHPKVGDLAMVSGYVKERVIEVTHDDDNNDGPADDLEMESEKRVVLELSVSKVWIKNPVTEAPETGTNTFAGRIGEPTPGGGMRIFNTVYMTPAAKKAAAKAAKAVEIAQNAATAPLNDDMTPNSSNEVSDAQAANVAVSDPEMAVPTQSEIEKPSESVESVTEQPNIEPRVEETAPTFAEPNLDFGEAPRVNVLAYDLMSNTFDEPEPDNAATEDTPVDVWDTPSTPTQAESPFVDENAEATHGDPPWDVENIETPTDQTRTYVEPVATGEPVVAETQHEVEATTSERASVAVLDKPETETSTNLIVAVGSLNARAQQIVDQDRWFVAGHSSPALRNMAMPKISALDTRERVLHVSHGGKDVYLFLVEQPESCAHKMLTMVNDGQASDLEWKPVGHLGGRDAKNVEWTIAYL